MWLVVGLGNPGAKYTATRHNLGFMVIDQLASDHQAGLFEDFCHSLKTETQIGQRKTVLVKPTTFMNCSGRAVFTSLGSYDLTPAELMVIHDDIDLDLGRLRIRARGGHGGHKGVQSIIEGIGTDDFVRIKIGVGPPPDGIDPADYVLSPFLNKEKETVALVVAKAAEAVEMVIKEGLAPAMNRFNTNFEEGTQL